jgi:peptidoglycan/LPS O-acetylase OafA/YrhL
MAWAGILYVISIQLLINIRDLFLGKETTESIDLSFVNLVLNLALLQIFSTNSQLLLFPLWSLSAEWITNLIYGFCKLFFSTEKLLIFLGFVFTALFLFGSFGAELESVIGSLGRCLYGFGIGLFFYKLRSAKDLSLISGKIPLSLFCFGVLYFSYFIIGMGFLLFIPWGFGLCIIILADERKWKTSVTKKISSFLGLHSYGVYVWHIPMQNSVYLVIKNIAPSINLDSLHFLHFVATLLLSVLASWIVIIFLERPLKRGLLGFS